MGKGKIIVIEGACDGIGKTTQYELLNKKLRGDGYNIATHHFPSYNTYHGQGVENYLKGEFGKPSEVSPYFVNSLYATDRAIAWHTKLKQQYEKGDIILLDRYTSSSIIYQSALFKTEEEKKMFMDFVVDYEFNKIGIPKPDATIFLHAPFELATEIRKARATNDGIENDIHERDIEFMRNVYDSATLAADYLEWDKIKCDENCKMKSIEDINSVIYKKLKQRGIANKEDMDYER